jgi:hypothetical protein
MEIVVKVNNYDPKLGIELNWINNFEIIASHNKDEIIIKANKEGLLSLGNHFISLAQEDVPIGTHIHLDEYNSLEEGSDEMIIERM